MRAAVEFVEMMEDLDFENFKVSVKSTSVPNTIGANRLLAQRIDYPLHLGVTESGTKWSGSLKSAVGLGTLLAEGVGDTIRISLSTFQAEEEVKVAWEILKALQLRERGPVLIACPTCGRLQFDMDTVVTEIERRLERYEQPVEVAVLGCAVNGIGEASHADFGITGAKNEGMIFAHGKPLRKVPQDRLVDELFAEIDKSLTAGGVEADERKAAEAAEWLERIEQENAGELTPERIAQMERQPPPRPRGGPPTEPEAEPEAVEAAASTARRPDPPARIPPQLSTELAPGQPRGVARVVSAAAACADAPAAPSRTPGRVSAARVHARPPRSSPRRRSRQGPPPRDGSARRVGLRAAPPARRCPSTPHPAPDSHRVPPGALHHDRHAYARRRRAWPRRRRTAGRSGTPTRPPPVWRPRAQGRRTAGTARSCAGAGTRYERSSFSFRSAACLGGSAWPWDRAGSTGGRTRCCRSGRPEGSRPAAAARSR